MSRRSQRGPRAATANADFGDRSAALRTARLPRCQRRRSHQRRRENPDLGDWSATFGTACLPRCSHHRRREKQWTAGLPRCQRRRSQRGPRASTVGDRSAQAVPIAARRTSAG